MSNTNRVLPSSAHTKLTPGQLRSGEVLILPEGSGVQIKVISGSVWLTTEGRDSDHVLGSAKSLDIKDMKNVVIEGLTESVFEVSKSAAN